MKKESRLKKALKIIDLVLSLTVLLLANIVFCIIFYISKVLKEVNFYELMFTLTNDAAGGSLPVIIDGIKVCFILFIVLMIVLIIPISNFKNIQVFIETKKRKIYIYPFILRKIKLLYACTILLISLLILAKTIKFDKYIENVTKTGDVYEMYYKNTNDVNITFPEVKRNLILVYLESTESSLVSKESGGAFDISRIPELEILALNNINFSNTSKLGGAYNLDLTKWTMAATVASTSGTPLSGDIIEGYGNYDEYIPSLNTLGDVLKNAGYNLELIQGSTKEFGGVDKYYNTHGNYKIFDVDTAKERGYISKYYKVWWGFEDKKLFEYSQNEILELSQKEEPFAVSIFTLDTHFKDGYLDPSCSKNFKDKYSNVFSCSSKMVNDFITWIKEQDFYENTTIVLIGDHLAMQNEYYSDYPDYTRSIYNVFINSPTKTLFNKNREFSSFDMYPTILASLGVKIEGEQLGFGVNLFSGVNTMIEELGKDKFNEEILKNSTYYNDVILSVSE